MKHYAILIWGVGSGCDNNIGCDKNWIFVGPISEQGMKYYLETLIDYYGEEEIWKFTVIPYDPENRLDFNAEDVIGNKKKRDKVSHKEKDFQG